MEEEKLQGSEAEARKSIKFSERLKEWWTNHKPSKRRLIQVYVALLTNAHLKGYLNGTWYKGATKYLCSPGLNCYSCPGAVASCPLGGLQNAFINSGTRAPYYVVGIILLLGLMFARTICGFFCPAGLGQELLYKIKSPKLGKSRFTRILSYLKYVILAVFVVALPIMFTGYSPVPAFCKYICPAGTFGAAVGLLSHPSNEALFAELGGLFTWKFCVLVGVIVASIFIYRFFCRFMCPLGAIYGLFNKFSFIGIKLDGDKCTDCGLCVSHCKMDIRKVGDHECINCGECISVCPAKAISWRGSKIFLHANEVSAPAVSEGAPSVAAMVQAPVREAAVTGGSGGEVSPQPDKNGGMTCVKVKRPISREKILRIAACCLAAAVLVLALVYYNFIYKPPVSGSAELQPGDICSDFTLECYNGDGEFTLSEHSDKIVFINFWATWCSGCIEELPDFERFYEENSDKVEVVAIHSANVTEDVQAYLDGKKDASSRAWRDWEITFAQDRGDISYSEIFSMFGGKDYPMTVVVGTDGKIVTKFGTGNYDYLNNILEILAVS